jgi:calcineurin-like phosphoesterase family protein
MEDILDVVQMDKSQIFFTSDLHLNHSNIIKYCNRPFKTIDDMNSTIINNWNSIVNTNDFVWVLGDFSLSNDMAFINKTLDGLNGYKFLVVGNHDSKSCINSKRWRGIYSLRDIRINYQVIVLCHYSMRVWYKSHYGAWHLYGHSHGTLPEENNLSFDVGVDVWNYTPVSLTQINRKMDDKKNAIAVGEKGNIDIREHNQKLNQKYFNEA